MLRDKVFINLNVAKENGFFDQGENLCGATAEEIADDMISFAADCEENTPEELLPFVKEWLDANRNS